MNKKLCTNENCKFVHLKGTARRVAQKVEAPNVSLPKKKDVSNTKEVPTQLVKSRPSIIEQQNNKDFLDLVDRMEKRFEDLA